MNREHFVRGAVLGIAIGYLLYSYPYFHPFPSITARGTALILNLLGISSVSSGYFVVVSFPDVSRIVKISIECSGILLLYVFTIIIFISPHIRLRDRLISLLLLPAILLGNQLRIVLSVFSGVYGSVDTLYFVHSTFGNVFVFLWVFVVYFLWLKITGNLRIISS